MSSIAADFGTTSVRPVLRITRRGRVVIGGLLALPALIAVASIALSATPATATGDSTAVAFEYVTVQPGESLWAVAQRVAPTADPREVIADIERFNGMESSGVAAGESLAIPASYTD